MIEGIRVKVCGLTTLVDAECADQCGMDYLGFNFYPKSPRYLPLEAYLAMAARLPDRRKVAVTVEPTAGELAALLAAGFDFFQIHFRHDLPLATVAAWSAAVGPEKLWLAPKLPPPVDLSTELLPLARLFMLDTFHAGFGGSGQTGDWSKFARHQKEHPEKFWLLAGGLNPENIGEAVRQSGTRFVDVNSGVEVAPGVKDHAKMQRLVARLRERRA